MGPNRDALVRPLFFAGQALTDRDLTDFVGWVDRRFALRRHSAGWGVASGLDVTADTVPGQLVASPGYAVDPAGRDLVPVEPIRAAIQKDAAWDVEANAATGDVRIGPFGERVPLKELAAFDVSLVAAANDRRPARTERAGCQPTRSQDTAALVLTRVPWNSKPGVGADESDTTVSDLFAAVKAVAGNLYALSVGTVFDFKQSTALRALFAGEFARHPERWLRTVPELPRWIEDRARGGKDYPGTPWDLAEVLGWMVDSYRQAHPVGPAADPKAGVPLARAWFRVQWRNPTLLCIRNHPPYRRSFAPDPIGPLDPRRFVGYSLHAAKVELRRDHVEIKREQYEPPASTALLAQELDRETKDFDGSIDPGDTVIAITVPDAPGSLLANRIVGAYQDDGAGVREPLTTTSTDLKIAFFKANKAGDADWAYGSASGTPLGGTTFPLGGTVAVAVTLVNPGPATKRLGIHDDVRQKYVEIADDWDRTKSLVATLKLEPVAGTAAPRFTVVARDADRATAIAKAGGFTIQSIPLADLTLQLANRDGNKPLAGELTLLDDGATEFQVKVQMKNTSPSTVSGNLMVGHAPPATPPVGTIVEAAMFAAGGSNPVAATFKNQTGLVIDAANGILKLPTDKAWYFWLEGTTDEFHQPPTLLPNRRSSTIAFRRHAVVVSIAKLPAADGNGNTHKLVVENKDTLGFRLTQVVVDVGGAKKFDGPVTLVVAGKATVEAARMKEIAAGPVTVGLTYAFDTNDGIANFTVTAP